MSWLLGFLGTSLSPTRREGLVSLHPSGSVTEADGFYVASGGLPETHHLGTNWAVVGLGLRYEDTHTSPLNHADWDRLLTPHAPDLRSLDGHFVAVRWQPGEVVCLTDPLGVRTLYLTTLPDGTAFSTRLDWLARLSGNTALDLFALGSHWLTFNQLSSASLLKGIQRLGPGGKATLTPTSTTLTEHPWSPRSTTPDPDAFARTLTAFLHPALPEGRTLSLGLSGGLDSRLLLALRASDREGFATHVFGDPEHPDAQLSRSLAAHLGLAQRSYQPPLPDPDTCLSLLRTHVAQTQAISPASSALGLWHYPRLYDDGAWLIDGGFGEVARRQFMNRLWHRGRAALRSGKPEAILPYLHVNRAEVFMQDALIDMQHGADAEIEKLLDSLPPRETLGEAGLLDLIGVRTRLPNFFGYEQNRLDGLIPGYMPFAQPSVLEAVFRTPLPLRQNGRFFRDLIRTRQPGLARFPLVKGTQTYPFRLGPVGAMVWTKAKARLRPSYRNIMRLAFLEALRPYALEAAATAHRHFGEYDPAKLTALVEGYYQGKHNRAAEVDWWLAFETWRQVLND